MNKLHYLMITVFSLSLFLLLPSSSQAATYVTCNSSTPCLDTNASGQYCRNMNGTGYQSVSVASVNAMCDSASEYWITRYQCHSDSPSLGQNGYCHTNNAYYNGTANGVCGSAHSTTGSVASAPSSNLCSTPRSTGVVTTATQYTWTCPGTSNGGGTANCYVGRKGVCGSAVTLNHTSPPSSGLCAGGNPSAVTTNALTYTWTCTGSGTDSTASCTAGRRYTTCNSTTQAPCLGQNTSGQYCRALGSSASVTNYSWTNTMLECNLEYPTRRYAPCPGQANDAGVGRSWHPDCSNPVCDASTPCDVRNASGQYCRKIGNGSYQWYSALSCTVDNFGQNFTCASTNGHCGYNTTTNAFDWIDSGHSAYTFSFTRNTNQYYPDSQITASFNTNIPADALGNASASRIRVTRTGSAGILTETNSYLNLSLWKYGSSNPYWIGLNTLPTNCYNNPAYISGNYNDTYYFASNYSITNNFRIDCNCGTASGQTFSSKPSANLCACGNASAVTGTGPWNWSCTCPAPAPSVGNTVSNCSANRTYTCTSKPANATACQNDESSLIGDVTSTLLSAYASCNLSNKCDYYCATPYKYDSNTCKLVADCGSAGGGTFSSPPTENLCDYGSPTVVNTGSNYTWQCLAPGGNDNCAASKRLSADIGECGSAKNTEYSVLENNSPNLCKTGHINNFEENTDSFTWTCDGTSSTDHCSAIKVPRPDDDDGRCGDADEKSFSTLDKYSPDLCREGDVINFKTDIDEYIWTCHGHDEDMRCTAVRIAAAENGECGTVSIEDTTATDISYKDLTATFPNLCVSGNTVNDFKKGLSKWTWTCSGNSVNATCTAKRSSWFKWMEK